MENIEHPTSNAEQRKHLRALGANIKSARIAAGITLPTMSKLSGVSKGNCSKVEHGGNVSALTLYKLCWSIGIHPRDVLPEYRPNGKRRNAGVKQNKTKPL